MARPDHKSKHERAKRWLLRGWKLTQQMAIEKWRLYRLAPVVSRINKNRRIIDNIGQPGKHAIYVLIK